MEAAMEGCLRGVCPILLRVCVLPQWLRLECEWAEEQLDAVDSERLVEDLDRSRAMSLRLRGGGCCCCCCCCGTFK